MAFSIAIELLNRATHDRSSFDCGFPELNSFLQTQAANLMEAHFVVTHVCVQREDDPALVPALLPIIGYYTLATGTVLIQELQLSAKARKKMPHYSNAPMALLGRLAVDTRHKGRGFGELLLMDALARIKQVSRKDMAVYGVLVDAKDAHAAAFYARYGFLSLTAAPLTLFMPVASIPD